MRRRRLETYRRAVELANTGKFESWRDIRDRLAREGYGRTSGLLASDRIRSMLDDHCAKSRQLAVEPQQVVPGEAEAADSWFGF
jgi:hypothetical protein